MRGILSLWTRTPHFRMRRGPLLIQTLAICLANEFFAETGLVTDAPGQALAAIFGWRFSDCSTALEDFAGEGLGHIWALGKLHACALQDRPFVQFDADALITHLPERLLNAPLIAQSPDFPEYYLGSDMEAAFRIGEMDPARGRHVAFNGGLLGGCDVPLVRAYAWAGLDLAKRFRHCALNGTTTSMFIEQYQLARFAERVGVQVTTLCDDCVTDPDSTPGYCHLVGSLKHSVERIARAEAWLQKDFPEEYRRFVAGWEFLSRSEIAPSS